MSFSAQIKKEILTTRQSRRKSWKAMAHGFLIFSRITKNEASLTTDNEEIVELFSEWAAKLLGRKTPVSYGEKQRSGKKVYTASLTQEQDRHDLARLVAGMDTAAMTGEADGAFIAGAFLACGSMADPEKSYHLEFVTKNKELCTGLCAVLERNIPGVKSTYRRGCHMVYYKDCVQIEDLLTLMGASKACLAVIDVEMIKEVRNRANRVTNCETANIGKTVAAADSKARDIRLILDERGIGFIPETLREAALLRLQNPELSLKELADLMEEPISRSGMYHRLEKLSEIAAEIKKQRSVQEGENI